jgi:AAA family ATP:ADP antiporter
MTDWLARFVDLRKGEGRPAFSSFMTLMGVVAAHTMLETARDALFLTKLPAKLLTLVYVLVALGTLVVTGLNAGFVRRFGQQNALLFTLVFTAYGTTVLHFVPVSSVSLFILYTWSALLGTVLAAQCWMLIGQTFTVTQGKRLFGAIASGGVLGAVVGASLSAGLLMVLPVGALLLVSSGIFLATAFFLTTVRADVEAATDEARSTPVSPSRTSSAPSSRGSSAADPSSPEALRPIATILASPYLRRMALLMVLSTATLLSVDYVFKSSAAHVIPPAELGRFFAGWYAVFNGASLFVQIFLTSRMLRQLGVVAALVLLPMLIAAGTGGIVITGSLIGLAIATKGADGAFRYSLHRVGSELLWMPLPAATRNVVRGVLDSAGSKTVQAVMATLLLFLASMHWAPPRVLATLTCVLAVAWIATTLSLRSRYLDLFRQALSKGTLDASAMTNDLDPTSIAAVLDALSSRDAARVVAGIELLSEKNNARLVPGLVLYHESDVVLLRALRFAVEAKRREWTPLVVRLLEHAQPEVRSAAVRALGTFGEREALDKALLDASPAVRAHATIVCATTATVDEPHQAPQIVALLELPGEQGDTAREALVQAIADHPDARWAELVLKLERDPHPAVSDRAVHAMAKIKDTRFIPPLVARLDRPATRQRAREALIRQGDEALEAAAQALANPKMPVRVRQHLPRTISRFGSQRAADLLVAVLPRESSGFIRYKALRGLGRLTADGRKVDRNLMEAELKKNLVEHLRLVSLADPLARGVGNELSPRAMKSHALLIDLLGDKERQALERSFRLLSILHPREDIRGAYVALRSGDVRLRAQALEFVDALTAGQRPTATGREARDLLRIATDELPAAERVARARAFLPTPPTTYEAALLIVLRESDETLATFGAYHALEVASDTFLSAVAELSRRRPELNVALPITMSNDVARRSARGGSALGG